MKVYSYRNFEKPARSKPFPNLEVPFASKKKSFKRMGQGVGLLASHRNFVFQIVSVCLLTLGLLLGFQVIVENSDINALANASGQEDVRALNNFGKNIKPTDNLELKEIATPEESNEIAETEQVAQEPVIETITYTVKAGDNLYAIAQQFGVEFTDIAEDNELSRPYNLQIGQQLYINR